MDVTLELPSDIPSKKIRWFFPAALSWLAEGTPNKIGQLDMLLLPAPDCHERVISHAAQSPYADSLMRLIVHQKRYATAGSCCDLAVDQSAPKYGDIRGISVLIGDKNYRQGVEGDRTCPYLSV